jgi:site-specific recombinase XerD
MGDSRSDDSATLTLAIAGFLDACRSPNTRAAYRADLRHFAHWCASNEKLNLLSADATDIARYRTACELDGSRPATVARRLSAVVSFGNYAAGHGLEPVLATDRNVERPTTLSASSTGVLGDADAEALVAAADQTGARAGLLVRLLMLDGLKVSEAARANASDLHGPAKHVSLTIEGRNSRTRLLHPDTSGAARRYLGRRRVGPLLLSEQRGQHTTRLTRFGIDYVIKEVARAAGFHAISANTLRRRYAMDAHARGTNLDTIRDNLGHATQRTTRRYLTPDNDAINNMP